VGSFDAVFYERPVDLNMHETTKITPVEFQAPTDALFIGPALWLSGAVRYKN
jgi:hypothetical protein